MYEYNFLINIFYFRLLNKHSKIYCMKTWIFLQNTFLTATRDSYRSMKKIGNFTNAALAAKLGTAFFDDLYATLQPINKIYTDAYDLWVSKKDQQQGKTASLTQLLSKLSSEKIRDWDIAIQGVYKDDSPQYIGLLPNKRTPFQNGSQEDRLSAVNALAIAIGTDAALDTVKADVLAYYNLLTTTLGIQKGSISTTGNSSDAVEAARIALGTELYGALGQLMNYYKETPEAAGAYFDLETIRNREQTVFKNTVDPGETVLALTHTFDAEEDILFINRGNTILRAALVKEPTDNIGAVFITLAANSEVRVDAVALGDIATNRYLKVQNTDATQEGAYTIELL